MIHLLVIKIYTSNSSLDQFVNRVAFYLVIVLTQGHFPKTTVSLALMNSHPNRPSRIFLNKPARVLQKLLALVKGYRSLLIRTQKLSYKSYSIHLHQFPELRLSGLRKNFLFLNKDNYSARGRQIMLWQWQKSQIKSCQGAAGQNKPTLPGLAVFPVISYHTGRH